ncbi:Uncharacterised protein [Achromobacter sp. 2789STDY5608628]|nr:Uncharacterised protein [Achromobacter sp. 2789STDY5608628]
MAADLGAQLLGHQQGRVARRVHQHHQELLAAIAEHEIARTTGLVHHLGELPQHLVAAGVAMLIVDRLEVIDIQQQHRERRALARGDQDLAADHRGQEAAIEHVGERIAAALDLGHHVEQAIEQVLDARHQFLQFTHLVRQRRRAALQQAGQHHVVQPRHRFGDLPQRRRALEQHAALVLQPQAELGGRQARQHLFRRAVVQTDQHRLAPFEQGGALALALGGNVLAQREQAVGLVVAGAAVDVAHEGAAHLLDRQVEQIADVLGRDRCRHAVQVTGAQAQRDFVLQDAGAGHHQVDRDVHARMHFAHLLLHRHQRRDVALLAHAQQALEPALHALVQAGGDDLVRQARAGLGIGQQGGIEGVDQLVGAVGHHRRDLAAGVGIDRRIDRLPGLGIGRAQVARLPGGIRRRRDCATARRHKTIRPKIPWRVSERHATGKTSADYA